MRVKINSSYRDTYWYANHIGEEFDVYDDCPNIYEVVDNEQISDCENLESVYFIDKEDCEVIEE